MVSALRSEDEDFEWYPTTAAMSDIIIADAKQRLDLDDIESVLDIGAGDARVLALFRASWPKATYFSIEKSTDRYRGHSIWLDGNTWRYRDTGGPVASDINRVCGHCSQPNREDGHDGCLGELAGVMNACCGHGCVEDAYVQLIDGSIVSGAEAIRAQGRMP